MKVIISSSELRALAAELPTASPERVVYITARLMQAADAKLARQIERAAATRRRNAAIRQTEIFR